MHCIYSSEGFHCVEGRGNVAGKGRGRGGVTNCGGCMDLNCFARTVAHG